MLLRDPVVPFLIVILVDPRDATTFVDLYDHTYMAFEVFPARLDGDISVWPDDVVRLSAYPELFQDCTCGCWDDGLAEES